MVREAFLWKGGIKCERQKMNDSLERVLELTTKMTSAELVVFFKKTSSF